MIKSYKLIIFFIIYQVKIKNSGSLILNGRAALVAGKDDYVSDEEEQQESNKRFNKSTDRADTMKILLESGCIPDAAMIHAARKRRQKARELGHDYIPVEDQQHEDKSKSRLIREEDHDRTDDDEDSQDRIDMSVNTEARDKEKRREAFLASQIPIKGFNPYIFHAIIR